MDQVGNTLMNSFLFNTMLLLLTAVAIVQFCTICFASYARLTAVDMLFGVQASRARTGGTAAAPNQARIGD